MGKIIPVLTNNYGLTATWLLEKYKDQFEQFRYAHSTMYLKDGTTLKLVHNREQLFGLEFDEFIVSPHYSDLRMEAESRSNMYKTRTGK